MALLRPSDFPSGWTPEPTRGNSAGPLGLQVSIAKCLHANLSLVKESQQPAGVESPAYSDSSGTKISDSITFQEYSSIAKKWFEMFDSPQTPACLNAAVASGLKYVISHPVTPGDALPSGTTIETSSVARMSLPPSADQSIAYRVVLPMTAQGVGFRVYADFVALRKGRAEVAMSFENTIIAGDIQAEERLVALTVHRLRGAG